jgi:hypothetical protein
METLPPPTQQPVKFTVNVSSLADPKHFEDSTAFDLAELVQMMALGLSIDDLASEAASVQSLTWAAWVWVRREYAPTLSWVDAQERIRLVFE